MRNIILALVLLASTICWAEKSAPNPAGYTITVHVLASRLVHNFDSGNTGQELTALIDGKKYVLLENHFGNDVLRVGDFKAKIVKDQTPRAYEYQRVYEFLFPDGQTREYTVVGEEQ